MLCKGLQKNFCIILHLCTNEHLIIAIKGIALREFKNSGKIGSNVSNFKSEAKIATLKLTLEAKLMNRELAPQIHSYAHLLLKIFVVMVVMCKDFLTWLSTI